MIRYPYLQDQPTSQVTTDVFRGLNLGSRIGEGEFAQMENLTSDHFPVLAPRGKRGRCYSASDPQGLYQVPGGAVYFCSGNCLNMFDGTQVYELARDLVTTQLPRQFALMGTQLVMAPDMKWLDIRNPFQGLQPMGAHFEKKEGSVTFSLCQRDGSAFGTFTAAKEAMENPANGDLWLDTTDRGLKQYSASAGEWVGVSTYVKISGLGEHPFQTGDGITLSGVDSHAPQDVSRLGGSYVIEHSGSDYLVITGLIAEAYTQDCATTALEIRRDVPQLDYIVEAGNRLWGCCHNVNEIYACKLGDITNWNVFSGISTDSWVGNIGSAGEFTGAVNHGGYPVFYKEHMKHKVWPSATAAHQITSTPCMGIAEGSSESIALCGEKLFYLSPQGICMDDGSGPVTIDQALGVCRYRNGAGAVYRNKYYLSASNEDGGHDLLVYDLSRGLWHREDDLDLQHLVAGDQALYGLSTKLWDLTGKYGIREDALHWSAVTGDLCQSSGEHQYLSRLTLRLALDIGSRLDIYARYDHAPLWVKLGTVYGTGPDSFSLPVRPRRCDHLQLKLEGQGMGKVYAITRTFEKGSVCR